MQPDSRGIMFDFVGVTALSGLFVLSYGQKHPFNAIDE